MAILYRGTISSFYKTNNLMNFHNNVVSDEKDTSIYLIVGREEPWSDNENDVNFAPPYPHDEPAGYADVWTRSLGFVKIQESAVTGIYPRFDWKDPKLGAAGLAFTVGQIVCTNTHINNSSPFADAGIMVYKCVQVPEEGTCSINNVDDRDTCIGLGGVWAGTPSLGTEANIPVEKGTAVDTKDGYLWEYMYTIPPDVVINDVTPDYIVVPFPSDVESDYSRWGLENLVTYDNQVDRTIYRMKCNLLRFKVPLSTEKFNELSDPAARGFRQLTIIYNPIEAINFYTDPNIIAQEDFYKPEELLLNSGEIIYMENRQPIYKSTYQEELVTLIFQF